MNKVENGPLGRVIRTFGYVLVLFSSVYLLFFLIKQFNFAFLNKIILEAEVIINSIYTVKNIESIVIIFFIGITILLWTLNKSYILRIFMTLLIIITIFDMSYENINIYLNSNTFQMVPNKILDFIHPILNKTIYKHPNLPKAINILVPFILYILFASKKPERISTESLAGGLLILTISIFLIYLPTIAVAEFFTTEWYNLIINILLSLGYVILIFSSIFGILGIFKK